MWPHITVPSGREPFKGGFKFSYSITGAVLDFFNFFLKTGAVRGAIIHIDGQTISTNEMS